MVSKASLACRIVAYHVENVSSIFGFVKEACINELVRFSKSGSPTRQQQKVKCLCATA